MMKILITFLIVAFPLMGMAAESLPKRMEFNKHIRPILSDRCFFCHGPDSGSREADLRLDQEEHLRKALKLEDGILERVTTTDPDEIMPPPKAKLKVTTREKALLKRWIEQGAVWEKHWAFIPPQKTVPPVIEDPWIKNDIDRFVLQKLKEAGMMPSPSASKERVLRRLSFAITGLPPTAEELAAFDGKQVEQEIDRLLAKPGYGERMATEWLDVARYADSYGFQRDNNRYVWPWRDWVVRQFNSNLPYSDFITWQLAGDLLPNPSDEQILATTFCRLHQQKVEGGSVPEEFRTEYVADRTHTMGTAFLGLTLECSRCHDHKYDPISTKEYYQFFAYFNNIDEAGLYSYFHTAVPTPTHAMANAGQRNTWDKLKQGVAEAETALAGVSDAEREAYATWRKSQNGPLEIPGQLAHVPFDEEKVGKHVNTLNAKLPANSSGRNRVVDGKKGKALELTGDDVVSLGTGDFRRYQPFSISIWMNTPDIKERAVVFHRSKAWTDSAQQGYQLLIEDGKLSVSVIHFWPGNAISLRTTEAIEPATWHHVVMGYDGSSRAAGLSLYVNGKKADCEVVRDHLTKSSRAGVKHFGLGERMRDRGFTKGKVDELVIVDRELSGAEVQQLFDGSVPEDLFEYYLAAVSETARSKRTELEKQVKALADFENGLTEIMVMKELPEPRQTRILTRGAYDTPADPVEAQTPAVLLPFPKDAPANRLGLAKWLTDPKHPLTARVTVNRYWQMHFGRGLVATSEDFGSQGALPTHPALLDWLSLRFIDSGWDVKALHKLMLSSATYQQDSRATPGADPDNELLARGPKLRLPAEMIRDQALAVSGLLAERVGGAPSKPYDLTESFKPMGHDKGEGLYRRSLYTYWKLTGPSPVMMALDAVKRDVCTVKRAPTSSPLQALVMLNGPQFVEAARVMAEATIKAHPEDEEAQLKTAFERITSLLPRAEELEVLKRLYAAQRAHFSEQPQLARGYLGVGHTKAAGNDPSTVAALATVLNGVMNLDQAVMLR